MGALGELLDDLGAERREVIGVARRHETLIDDDLLIDDVAPGVADIGADARIRRERPAADEIGFDQRPGAMADHADRLAARKECLQERDHVVVLAQVVGVGDAAGENQSVVIVGGRVGDDGVDGELPGRLEIVVHRLDLSGFQRDQLGCGAGVLDRLARLLELDPLDAVGGEDRDLLALQFI